MMRFFFSPTFSSLLVFLIFKQVLMTAFVMSSFLGLGPDEAQYWTWSLSPDFGYYSKPPGIAWQIAAGTFFFGETELGVRFGALLVGFIFPLLIYRLAKICFSDPIVSYFSGLIAAFAPLGFLASLLAITDGGLIIFWTLALTELARAIKSEKTPDYLYIGFVIAIGALFKWPIYLIWPLTLVSMITLKPLRSRTFFLGFFISILGLLPSLYWNFHHSFVTFKHVAGNITGSKLDEAPTFLFKGNFLDFLLAQIALMSPIWFFLMTAVIWNYFRKPRNIAPIEQLLIYFGPLPLAVYLFFSFIKKMQGNWAEFTYPALIIMTAYGALYTFQSGKKWLKIGFILSITLVAIAFSIPLVQTKLSALPYSINPFKHNLGWENLKPALLKSGYDSDKHFVFSDKYQTTSELYFYGDKQKKAYFFNLQGARQNQFDFWPGMKEEVIGKDGFFVIVENEPHLSRQKETLLKKTPKLLTPYFKDIEFVGEFPLFQIGGASVKSALIWKGEDYNGKTPKTSELF